MEKIELSGFLISVRAPSKERLNLVVDTSSIPSSDYIPFITKLQDMLTYIDEKYKERELRGRSVKGKHRKVGKARVRHLSFSPLPSRFLNTIGAIRMKSYKELNEQCLVLEEEHVGMYRRNVYLLPYPRAPGFLKEVGAWNEEIRELNSQISAYQRSEEMQELRKLLADAGLYVERTDFMVPEVEVELVPFTITPEADLGLLDRMSPEGAVLVREALSKSRRAFLRKAVTKLADEVNSILERIAERKIRYVDEWLRELRDKCEDIGMKSLAETVSVCMDELSRGRSPEVLKELRRKVDGRVKSLIDSI